MSRKGINFKHGYSQDRKDREYWIWVGIRQRCYNPNCRAFKNYGARGITVCKRWNSFANFLEDMGRRPTSAHTLERENNNLGYGPGNCVWATRFAQGNNSRRNRKITIGKKTMNLSQWARETGVDAKKAWKRLWRGWTPEEALELQ